MIHTKLIVAMTTFLFLPGIIAGQEAREMVKLADEKARGNTSKGVVTITTVRPTWSREMTIKSWSKGNDLALILVTAPVKEKGVVFLKRGKEVWNWIPTIERNVKMPPSMMNQSWMGTDFTNDDLVKEASIIEDYTHRFIGDTVMDGRSCKKIEMIPKPEAAVVWGKIYLCIDRKDYLMLYAEYFDEEGELINIMRSGDIRLLGGRLLPSVMEMVPADKKGHKTILTYTSMEFNQPIDDSFFTVQNMTRVK
jgi:outer membrane lipoprotein-sorting protein